MNNFRERAAFWPFLLMTINKNIALRHSIFFSLKLAYKQIPCHEKDIIGF